MNECLRCGKCCRTLASKAIGMSPEVIDYLLKRGCTVDDDYLLIPHRCQHLRLDEKLSEYKLEDTTPTGEPGPYKRLITPKYKCDIHDTEEYPIICKRFHGHGAYYIPSGCVFFNRNDEEREHNIYIKQLQRAQNKSKKQRSLVVDEESG
jgi:hypothetical protein